MGTIYINESQAQELVNRILQEALVVNSTQVNDVKNYLNRCYRVNADYDDIGEDGLPKETINITYYIQGKPKMNLKREQMLDVISDKFKHFVKDDASRYAYMDQILTDWMNNTIKPTGQLSVNYIPDQTILKFKKYKRNKAKTKDSDNKKDDKKDNKKRDKK